MAVFSKQAFENIFENPHQDRLKQTDRILLENSPRSAAFLYLSGRTTLGERTHPRQPPTHVFIACSETDTEPPDMPPLQSRTGVSGCHGSCDFSGLFLSVPPPSPLCLGERLGLGDSGKMDVGLPFKSGVPTPSRGHCKKKKELVSGFSL